MVQDLLQEKGLTSTPDQARNVAHEYADLLWHTHKYIGYGIAFLLLCRIIIEFAQPSGETIKAKISRVLKFRYSTPEQKKNRTHYLWVQGGYIFFYFSILVMAITGLGLAYEDVPFLKKIHGSISNLHTVFQYCIYGYILFHITGVVIAESRFPGLVSRMIHGKKNIS
jgi:cytochrome b561